ncbi:MAG: hypothetical protein KGI54_17875 [Pseudomonadota bacterium]|nr:hypothetical protein [Pseudomonadota bacterium]
MNSHKNARLTLLGRAHMLKQAAHIGTPARRRPSWNQPASRTEDGLKYALVCLPGSNAVRSDLDWLRA